MHDQDDYDPWDPWQVEIDMRVAELEYATEAERLRAELDELARENAALRDELARAHGLN